MSEAIWGSDNYPLVRDRRPCATPEAPAMVRPPCPRFCACSPVVAPPSPQSFGARAETYERARGFAARRGRAAGTPAAAARHLPACSSLAAAPGCSAGICSRAIPTGRFLLTDLAPSMVEQCRRNLARRGQAAHQLRDHGRRAPDGRRALRPHRHQHDAALARRSVAALATLRQRLAPGGVLIYATISGKSFPEWRAVLASTRPADRPPRHPRCFPASSMRSASSPDARHARLPAPHEGGRRAHPTRGLAAAAARQHFAAPSAPPMRRMAAASPGTSSMARLAREASVEPLDQPGIGAGRARRR